MFLHKRCCALALAALFSSLTLGAAHAQHAAVPPAPAREDFTLFHDTHLALTNVDVIDGTGGPVKRAQTLVIRDGRIVGMGDATQLQIPANARVRDMTGHTVMPGFVMMHEHMFYPTTMGNYHELPRSFPRLYLAGGATTVRTAGSMSPIADINLRDEIRKGTIPGPDIHVTGPFIEGPGLLFLKVKITRDAADARSLVDYWSREGATSYKVYMQIPRANLQAVLQEAHARKHKVTGHLCSITYREAADMGIDNLEHGFFAATDFVTGKQPDVCPKNTDVLNSIAALDPDGAEAKALIDHLVAKRVALTSTLTIFETFAAGRPLAPPGALELLSPDLRELYMTRWSAIAQQGRNQWSDLLKIGMRLEKRFVEAGGQLLAGTDPTGYGGVIAGFSNMRQLELLLEAGFTLPQAVKISTLNGATFLAVARDVGSLEVGKRADLIALKGDVQADRAALRNIAWTMKAGVAYDRAKILAAMRGKVGLF